MDIEKITKKLEPLMPNEVNHWLKTRDLAESELQDLIDKQIISSAHQKLGNFRKKILLSLPPQNKAKGAIHLGTICYEKEKWPVGISLSELNQNLAIYGRSGAGKTNVAFHILQQLAEKKIPFLFLDWKRTARHLIPHIKQKVNIYTPGRSLSRFPFNPFIRPPGIEPNVYINQIIDILAEAYTLGDGSKSILQKSLAKLYEDGNYCPTANELLHEIEITPQKGRAHGWKISTVRALQSLTFSDVSSEDSISQKQLVQMLLKENTIIELDALSQSTKKFLIPLLCLWLYYVKLKDTSREKLELVIFIEEAHNVLYKQEQKAKESIMEMLLRQCREIGIGVIVVDQHIHLLSSVALGNVYTSICLNQKDPMDINKAAGLSLVDSNEKKYFSMLPIGQGIVKLQDRWQRPFLVQFPLINIRKGLVTDGMITRYVHSSRTSSKRQDFNRGKGHIERNLTVDIPLNELDLLFLQDVLNHPDDGVKKRYQRLNISVGKGNRTKEHLLDTGWVKSQVVNIGKTRKVLLRLTQEAKESLGIENKVPEKASMVHEYWKRYYARKYQEKGYKVILETPRTTGAVDVLALKDGRSMAIEIETGKSNAVWNVKQNLLSKFDEILVVVTDKKAFEKVERELAGADLVIDGRVKIIKVSDA